MFLRAAFQCWVEARSRATRTLHVAARVQSGRIDKIDVDWHYFVDCRHPMRVLTLPAVVTPAPTTGVTTVPEGEVFVTLHFGRKRCCGRQRNDRRFHCVEKLFIGTAISVDTLMTTVCRA